MNTQWKIYLDKRVQGEGLVGSPILFVGEAPGEDECIFNRPFVGRAGQKLDDSLANNGIVRSQIRLENLCEYRPYGNIFENLFGLPQLEYCIQRVHEYIKTHRPVIIGALGNYPMWHLTRKGKRTKGGTVSGIGNWRGSILPYVDDNGQTHHDIKVVPTYHPSAVAREASIYPIFDMDIRRIKHDAAFRGLNYPEREIICNPRGLDLERHVQEICSSSAFTFDIETIRNSTTILSISFSPSPHKALVIAPGDSEGNRAIFRLLQSEARKVPHFGNFDTTQLRLNGFEIRQDVDSINFDRPYFFDTYTGAHILEPEMPKTLAYENSIRSRKPFYKNEGKSEFVEGDRKGWSSKFDRNKLFLYNGDDTCSTYEVFLGQYEEIMDLPVDVRAIFDFEMSEIELQQHISMSGMLIDQARLELFKQALFVRWAKLQWLIDGVLQKKINVKSPLLKDILYGKEADGGLGLPPRYKDKKPSANDDALVASIGWIQDKVNTSVREETKQKYRSRLYIVKGIREIKGIRQFLSSYAMAKYNEDGRSRSTYKNGPETGRWAASKHVDGTGYNHQTNPRDPVEVEEEDFEKYKSLFDAMNGIVVQDFKEQDEALDELEEELG